jgi:hypothetical protein
MPSSLCLLWFEPQAAVNCRAMCQSPTLGGGSRRLPPCPSTLALTCRWRSRPQHHLRKSRPLSAYGVLPEHRPPSSRWNLLSSRTSHFLSPITTWSRIPLEAWKQPDTRWRPPRVDLESGGAVQGTAPSHMLDPPQLARIVIYPQHKEPPQGLRLRPDRCWLGHRACPNRERRPTKVEGCADCAYPFPCARSSEKSGCVAFASCHQRRQPWRT